MENDFMLQKDRDRSEITAVFTIFGRQVDSFKPGRNNRNNGNHSELHGKKGPFETYNSKLKKIALPIFSSNQFTKKSISPRPFLTDLVGIRVVNSVRLGAHWCYFQSQVAP